MPDNPNTKKPSEQPALDAEDWELAFAAYEGHTNAALNMAFNLMVMKGYLSYDPPKIEAVLKGMIMPSSLCIPTLSSMMYVTTGTSK